MHFIDVNVLRTQVKLTKLSFFTHSQVIFRRLKKAIQFLLFSNLYLAIIAILACKASLRLFGLPASQHLLLFVGAATLCSYSLHWALTYAENTPLQNMPLQNTPLQNTRLQNTRLQNTYVNDNYSENSSLENTASERLIWTKKHRKVLYLFGILGGIVAAFFAIEFRHFWFILLPLAALTFIYTAPKIPFSPFTYLRGKAIAKTLYLSLVWTIVIAVLPMVFAKVTWTAAMTCYLVNRFCFTFALCALFDDRDKGTDALSGIKNLLSTLSETAFDRFFYLLLSLLFGSFIGLNACFFTIKQLFPFLFTTVLLLLFYKKIKRTNSDYWYYGVLDGLMAAF
ncbi:MAG: hypothetical protein RI894_1420 [Bacteroidota bacterium]